MVQLTVREIYVKNGLKEILGLRFFTRPIKDCQQPEMQVLRKLTVISSVFAIVMTYIILGSWNYYLMVLPNIQKLIL